eukprot:1195149-Prorocentrum_minimum.AAC.2
MGWPLVRVVQPRSKSHTIVDPFALRVRSVAKDDTETKEAPTETLIETLLFFCTRRRCTRRARCGRQWSSRALRTTACCATWRRSVGLLFVYHGCSPYRSVLVIRGVYSPPYVEFSAFAVLRVLRFIPIEGKNSPPDGESWSSTHADAVFTTSAQINKATS